MQIDWSQTQVRLKQAGRVRCEPGWALRPSWSKRLSDFDLWFIGEGSGHMRMRQGVIDLRPGLCFWMRPGGLYDATQHLNDPLTVSYAHFDLVERTGKLRSFKKPLPPEVFTPLNTTLVDTILQRLASSPLSPLALLSQRPVMKRRAESLVRHRDVSASDQPLPEHDAVSQTLFRGLLMELDAESDSAGLGTRGTELHHRQLVQMLAMRITERPGHDHPMTELAKKAGYSPAHFARVFKQIIGIGPQAYVIRARIDRAKQLLVESSLSISQIADVLGYDSLYFFSRQFKSKTGTTPRQYRKGGSAADVG